MPARRAKLPGQATQVDNSLWQLTSGWGRANLDGPGPTHRAPSTGPPPRDRRACRAWRQAYCTVCHRRRGVLRG
jgi:hypothetical protein